MSKVLELTRRQRECLSWVGEGKSSDDIGTILGISRYTVDEHILVACQKLNVRTRMQAVLLMASNASQPPIDEGSYTI